MNTQTRDALLAELHEMNDEYETLADGVRPYMYANSPNTPNGHGVEYFHFQGDARITGLESAVLHMRTLLETERARRFLTKEQAAACLVIVQKYLGEDADPKLYAPGHEGPFWNISFEGGDDWAIYITHNESITWPEGVFPEPVASWCLGLHRA